jgi:hypothetical protein
VVLVGKFDSAKETINVEKITPASQQGGPKYASAADKSLDCLLQQQASIPGKRRIEIVDKILRKDVRISAKE